MASEVIAYVAVSLDGYIAGKGGTVDFLTEFGSDEYEYDEFVESVGAVVMGSTTYEQILGWGWPYGSTPGLVLTRTGDHLLCEGYGRSDHGVRRGSDDAALGRRGR